MYFIVIELIIGTSVGVLYSYICNLYFFVDCQLNDNWFYIGVPYIYVYNNPIIHQYLNSMLLWYLQVIVFPRDLSLYCRNVMPHCIYSYLLSLPYIVFNRK